MKRTEAQISSLFRAIMEDLNILEMPGTFKNIGEMIGETGEIRKSGFEFLFKLYPKYRGRFIIVVSFLEPGTSGSFRYFRSEEIYESDETLSEYFGEGLVEIREFKNQR